MLKNIVVLDLPYYLNLKNDCEQLQKQSTKLEKELRNQWEKHHDLAMNFAVFMGKALAKEHKYSLNIEVIPEKLEIKGLLSVEEEQLKETFKMLPAGYHELVLRTFKENIDRYRQEFEKDDEN